MVRHKMSSAPERHLSTRPRCIVGKVSWQNTNPQFRLQITDQLKFRNQNFLRRSHFVVEVEEALRAVDIVKRSKARNRPVNVHGVCSEFSSRGEEHPMGRNTTHQNTVVAGDVSKVTQLAYYWVVAHRT